MEIILASKNLHKIEEIKNIAFDNKFEGDILCHPDIEIPEIEENGKSFYDNAIIKAEYIYNLYKKPVLSDDSGLCVQKLNGFPGIYSSRYSGGNSQKNIEKLVIELKGVKKSDRKAKFVCVVCLYLSPEEIFLFTGEVYGIILEKCIGLNGFGYDPVFYLPDYKLTMAQISSEQKNRISHRSLAFSRFFKFVDKI
ncbi:MAG: RdgB/HAM1 family non-canonical purine NTP pyrophosphatase [Candidatus Muirbacterium halophilum]|nr:RdgB/HAM1 family non-canonical purine NTP pyrophosphatase [Candidatus Muirbacterium halophilum]MCK9474586.1 RdgB/HAM1 family non-canonical purine NTP pyrophosphatase [Candidatus Muirbacterium halophilum]